jgi:anti-sigma regulatory factor (Ser/Thr protein kinase)
MALSWFGPVTGGHLMHPLIESRVAVGLPVAEPGAPRRDLGNWPEALASPAVYRGDHYEAAHENTPHHARLLVSAALADWGLWPVAGDAVVCVSELVGNAVKHAEQSPMVSVGVRCWARSAVFLEVGDGDPRMPRPGTEVAAMAERGRGLRIVGELADAWWPRRVEGGGKVVYARFDLARYEVDRGRRGAAG